MFLLSATSSFTEYEVNSLSLPGLSGPYYSCTSVPAALPFRHVLKTKIAPKQIVTLCEKDRRLRHWTIGWLRGL